MNTPFMTMGQRNFGSSIQDILKQLDLFFISQSTMASSNMYADKDRLVAHADQVLFSPKESKKPKHASVYELELSNEICAYCLKQKTEYVRYCVFDALFSMSRSTSKDYRKHILVITASLAVALKSSATLQCVALWMATAPKEDVIYIAEFLEKDFCQVMPESSQQLKSCNAVSDKFCTILLSAFCAKYAMKDPTFSEKVIEYPSDILLDIVQSWILENPQMPFSIILKMDQLWHTVLTSTRNPEKCLSLSPLAGLIQWSVKLPFAPPEKYEDNKQSHAEIPYPELQSRLHFGILTSILSTKECINAMKQGILGKESDFQLWGKTDAHKLVGGLLAYSADNPDESAMTLAVDRFAQVSQIAMSAEVLVITKVQFQSLTDPLPKTPLLDMVAYGPGSKPAVEDVTMG